MRIVFMGTPDFAAVALEALITSEYGADIVGVVTRQDKPKNRGHAMTPPPVKVLAESRGLPVFQPQNLKTENFGETLAELAPDIIIVCLMRRNTAVSTFTALFCRNTAVRRPFSAPSWQVKRKWALRSCIWKRAWTRAI